MIKEYVGTMYREGCRDEAHEVEVNHGDGYLHGVCDICVEPVEHFDVGEIVVEKCDMYEIEDAAIDHDWVVMGKHLICPECKEKIGAIKGDIKVVEKGADDGK